jgi:hypothetical protein
MAKDIYIYAPGVSSFLFFPHRSSPRPIPVTGQRSRSSFASADRRVISSLVFFFLLFFLKLLYIFLSEFSAGSSKLLRYSCTPTPCTVFSLIFPFARRVPLQRAESAATRVSFLPRNAFKSPCGIQFLNRGK